RRQQLRGCAEGDGRLAEPEDAAAADRGHRRDRRDGRHRGAGQGVAGAAAGGRQGSAATALTESPSPPAPLPQAGEGAAGVSPLTRLRERGRGRGGLFTEESGMSNLDHAKSMRSAQTLAEERLGIFCVPTASSASSSSARNRSAPISSTSFAWNAAS